MTDKDNSNVSENADHEKQLSEPEWEREIEMQELKLRIRALVIPVLAVLISWLVLLWFAPIHN